MRLARQKRVILVACLVVLVFAVAVLVTINYQRIWRLFPTLLSVFLTLDKVYSFIRKKHPDPFWRLTELKMLLINSQVRWRASADIEYQADSIEKIIYKLWNEHFLREWSRTRIFELNDNRLFAKLDGLDIEILYYFDIDNQKATIHAEILEYHAPFVETSDVIDNKIIPIFETISKNSPAKINESYLLNIFFEDGKNPFIGAYVNKNNIHDLVSFKCVLQPKIYGDKGTVNINKDNLELITSRLTSLSYLTHKYLTITGV